MMVEILNASVATFTVARLVTHIATTIFAIEELSGNPLPKLFKSILKASILLARVVAILDHDPVRRINRTGNKSGDHQNNEGA